MAEFCDCILLTVLCLCCGCNSYFIGTYRGRHIIRTMENRHTVLIFKALSEETDKVNPNLGQITDPYVKELEELNFTVRTVPVLDFMYKNLDILKDRLDHPEQYSGLVLTSPRCVRGVISAISNSSLHSEWCSHPIFTVGETTARIVNTNLNLKTEGSCAGNGAALAPIILSYNIDKPLLHPCGNLKMDGLERALAKGNVALDCVEVYDTMPHPNIEKNVLDALAEEVPEYVVYFSPSGINSSLPFFKQTDVDLNQIKWVSIGPTTESALVSHGLKVSCTAMKPTPKSLAEAILGTLS